ncbi:MAG: hypothetical protein Kow0025_09080 [Thermodesulfovibrionales bacterium]
MRSVRKSPVARITNLMALCLAVAVAAALPLVYWLVSSRYVASSLAGEAVIYSSFASRMVSENPEFWRFEQLRLREFLSDHPFGDHSETRRIVDLDGDVIAESRQAVRAPFITHVEDVYDSGTVVARIVIERSMEGVLRRTLVAALAGLALGGAMYAFIRLFPLRALNRALYSLFEERERFRAVFESALTGAAVVDREGAILQANQAWHAMLHYDHGELAGRNFFDITYLEDVVRDSRMFAEMVEGRRSFYRMEKRQVLKEGDLLWTDTILYAVHDDKGDFKYGISIIGDISERKSLEKKLTHTAFHDALTGLPNRTLFMDRLKMQLARSERQEDLFFAVLFLDLDRFKNVNDSLGHALGDEMLVEVARRLKNCVRPYDTVARLGGDEFAILLDDIVSLDRAVQVAQRINADLSLPFMLGGHEVFTSASIGIATGDDSSRPDNILRNADIAMYQAKRQGKACHVIFDEGMRSKASWLLNMENSLRKAMENGEFRLQYQPIVSLRTGEVAGFEALLRWQSPVEGNVPPSEFIPVAEESGLIVPLGKWVIGEACRQAARWRRAQRGEQPVTVSVNISCKQFSPDLVEHIEKTLAETGLRPEALKLEITESVIMDSPATAAPLLARVKEIGLKVHMDDFGTGYSSLSHLHSIPLDALKIDRSFVKLMCADKGASEITGTIISLAKSLNIEVIAEGVEHRDQAERLRELGCDYCQGYLFSRPLEGRDAEALLEERRTFALPAGSLKRG